MIRRSPVLRREAIRRSQRGGPPAAASTPRAPTPRSPGCALLLLLAVTALGCPPESEVPPPRAGAMHAERIAYRPFPLPGAEGHVDPMGGNLLLRRVDLSRDTRLGALEIGAVYNSATGRWTWSFEPRYGSRFFTDETGARHDVSGVPDGAAVPGTRWVKLDAHRVRTRSGRVHVFDLGRRLASVHWAGAEWPRLQLVRRLLAGERRVVRIDQCRSESLCQVLYQLRRDDAGRVTAIEDPSGRRAELEWANGRLVGARGALAVAEGRPGMRYEYAGALLTAVTNGDGERTEIDYRGGRVAGLRRIGEGDPEDRLAYEGAVDGLFSTRWTDALGHERVYRYDAQRRLHEIWNVAVDERTTWTWTGARPASRTDADGSTRFFTWQDDDLVREVLPNGNVRRISYAPDASDREDPPHRPILRIEDSLGLVEEHAYDERGRRISSSNGAGEITSFGWDADSHLVSISSPWGQVTELWGHAGHGHPMSINRSGSILPEQIREYDAVGNSTRGSPIGEPGPGGVDGRRYDGDRNLRGVRLADGGTIEIEVRGDGRRTRLSRPNGDDHELAYDALGRLVARHERVDGVWQTTRFEYDAVDNRTAVERPNGMRQEWEHDAAGRVVRMRNLRDGVLEGEASFDWENGLLVRSQDSLRGGTERRSYDAAGRLARIDHPDGRTTFHAHDLRDRRTLVAWLEPDGALVGVVQTRYDGADRPIEIREGGTPVLTRSWLNGRLDEVRYGNGLVRRYHYRAEGGPLEGIETFDAQGQQVESTTIARNLRWPVFEIEVRTSLEGAISATSEEVYELSEYAEFAVLVNRPRVTRFRGAGLETELVWDEQSNLLAAGDTEYRYNAEGNRLLEIRPAAGDPISYAYDAAGFVVSRAGVPLGWHANGRLAFHGPDRFLWDVQGAPLESTVDGVTTRSGWDGGVTTDAAGLPLSVDLDELSIDLQSGERLYRHLDFRGNVKFTSDDDGAARSLYTYSPFGVEQVAGDDDDPVRFVARTEIGELMLMGARIYDPAAARFLSPDPIFQVVNQYAYTLGNPVQFHDRTGATAASQAGGDGGGISGAQAVGLVGNGFLLAAAIAAVTGNLAVAGTLGLAGMILVIMSMAMTL